MSSKSCETVSDLSMMKIQPQVHSSGKPLKRLLGVWVLFAAIFIYAGPMHAQNWSSGGPLSSLQQGFDVTFYDIQLEIHPELQEISGTVTAHVFALEHDINQVEFDLVNHFKVTAVRYSDSPLSFTHEQDKLVVDLPRKLGANQIMPLEISYSGAPPVAVRPPWQGGFTWARDSEDRHWVSVSCQLEGAKLWLPAKDHPTSRADSVRIDVTVPKPYFVASNGLLELQEVVDEARQRFVWMTRYPIHNYNINVTMGIFEEVRTAYLTEVGDEMPVVFYVLESYAHEGPQLLKMTLQKLYQLRAYYGEYAFTTEKFGLVHTPYLGMEHQTINAYGNDFEYTVIDDRPYDWLLLHEMGHEWWGNAVTVRDWADFWIHEGITTFTDALFLWDFYSPEVYYDKIREYVGFIRNHQPIIPGTDVTSAEVYNHDVYYKGAWFMHTLMHVLGRDTFLEAMRSFAVSNRYGYTDTDAIRAYLQLYTEIPLAPLFELYLYQTDLPRFELHEVSDQTWAVYLSGAELTIPVEVRTSAGVQLIQLGTEAQHIHSQDKPVLDPQFWYLTENLFDR
ncbi:Peptidase family M1 [Cyclonatronum proteinivorum]|uniref:Peptidase family M1 n=1 Tax=Cyclonatronum proteinivorum TaxID=1457365 RepID=A0A345UJ34_9BACT|nr:M1 family metallopeptidase [Cyclonatronum proteinivorum]AXJ00486.1 Peptidase family M1 [Cyclonatronum proteinivorum]